ncbi:MAG TPA: energy transducer TonB [Pseudoduganella sp.]
MRLAALLLTLSLATAAQADEYHLKTAEARTGTLIKRDAAIGTLPFDKAYADLSAEDKARFRAIYESMAEDDEPPYPLHGFKSLYRKIEVLNRKLDARGMLDLALLVGPDGLAQTVTVYKSPDDELTRSVSYLLMQEKFKPALCHGQPCAQEFPFRVNFTMRR